MIVERLFLTVPWGCLQFVIVVFPDHTHLLFLNTSKGSICCPALSRVTSDDIKEGMAEQGVTDVHRITVRRDGVIKLTNTYVLTFNSPNLPTVVKIGFKEEKADCFA